MDRPVRILVAEDEAVNRIVIAKLLEVVGVLADVVSDGRAAVAAATAEHYDLVLMDCHMPVMDGFEATRALRGMAHGASSGSIPIVALTAGDPVADAGWVEAGMDAHLRKPVDLRRLSETIERLTESIPATPAGLA